jgi:hypothetical protein
MPPYRTRITAKNTHLVIESNRIASGMFIAFLLTAFPAFRQETTNVSASALFAIVYNTAI